MWISVPQIAVFFIFNRTSSCPTTGISTSSIQMPGFANFLTSAFIFRMVASPDLILTKNLPD